MGNAVCLPGGEEDRGVVKVGMMAVGADHSEIDDHTLDIALGAGAAGLK
jgi:hypothetical protein